MTTTLNAVAFTGHRTIRTEHLPSIKNILSALIIRCYDLGFRTFYSGMAIGFDLLAAETILELKESYPSMKLIAVIPFKGQEQYFSEEDKVRYHQAIRSADECICLCEHYYREGYRDRNLFLVNNCNNMVAYYDGSTFKSGTAQTLRMAKQAGKPILNIFNSL